MRDDDGLYDPRPHEDEDELAPAASSRVPSETTGSGGAYRVRSGDTWDLAREAYLSGETAESICARFDLGLSNFRERARQGGWRRCDQPDREPLPVDADDDIDVDADYAALAEHALRQLRRAMARGRASAASSWMRLHDRLTARAADEAEAGRKAAETAEARRRADSLARIDAASDAALGIEALARRIATADPRDSAGRAAIDAELARLDATLRGVLADKPDELDELDAFLHDPPPLAGRG